jgi:hypothetical protein
LSQKSELKDLSSVVGANLLDHYLSSMQQQLKDAIELENKIEFKEEKIKKRRDFLEGQLTNFHKMVALLAGNKQTRQKLRYQINKVIRDIRDPFFYDPLYQADVTNLMCAMTSAFEGNFGRKEDVQLQTLLVILSKVSLMRDQVMIPEKFKKMLDNWDNMEEDN